MNRYRKSLCRPQAAPASSRHGRPTACISGASGRALKSPSTTEGALLLSTASRIVATCLLSPCRTDQVSRPDLQLTVGSGNQSSEGLSGVPRPHDVGRGRMLDSTIGYRLKIMLP